MMKSMVVLACVLTFARGAAAQPPAAQTPPQSLVAEVQGMYGTLNGYISKAAAQFPDAKLTWQPTPAVRSWARLIAHIADDNNNACATLAGAQRPARLDTDDTQNSAANTMSKADLQKALAESFALCDKAFASITDATMMERNGNRSKIGTLIPNTSHINEHYGNIVTYMRLNDIVPPSTAGRGMGPGPGGPPMGR
jgi:hypothetical protein